MKPAAFTYLRPSTVDEAVEMLADGGSKVLAGGQSLVPILSMRLASPAALVDINHVADLDSVDVDDRCMRVGALARHRRVELDSDAPRHGNVLPRMALAHVAHPTIRNRGTTVGSLVHADPAAELPAVLCLLDGTVEARSAARGLRTISAADFFVGPMESALGADELAVAAVFPHPPAHSGAAWLELSRRRGDYAIVGVGAVLTLDEGGYIVAGRLGLIGVGQRPVVVDIAPAVHGRLASSVGSLDARARLGDVEELISDAIDPEGDIHATAAYRAHVARQLSTRAVVEAIWNATDGGPDDGPDPDDGWDVDDD